MNNFVFTGPECSGKTTLAKYFSESKYGVFVEEYAREYLEKLDRDYNQNDLLEIAKGQFSLQEKAKKQKNKKLFFDTDLLTIKIWSEVKYGKCDSWILDRISSNKNNLYILCKPDFNWEFDPLRESPQMRDELYEIYKNELIKFSFSFMEVEGEFKKRVNTLFDII